MSRGNSAAKGIDHFEGIGIWPGQSSCVLVAALDSRLISPFEGSAGEDSELDAAWAVGR